MASKTTQCRLVTKVESHRHSPRSDVRDRRAIPPAPETLVTAHGLPEEAEYLTKMTKALDTFAADYHICNRWSGCTV